MNEPKVLLDVRLTLSDSLAREARASGLLEPQAIEALLREELGRRRRERLFGAEDSLAALEPPALNDAEIEAEIAAAREARMHRYARRW
jgi:hypothetical protein